jgi:hypothetical protein
MKKMSDLWQPIATAPKDGTEIDVWRERCWTPYVLSNGTMHGEWIEARRLTNVHWMKGGIQYDCTVKPPKNTIADGWAEFKIMLAHSQSSITHWMPLPNPPE